jgi:Domain of unknown function (DUF4345)
MNRRLLQLTLAILSLSPLTFGALGMVYGAAWLGGGGGASLDSHFRYLSGIFFALGVALWTCIPRIEAMGERFRIIGLAVIVGGCARLYGMATGEMPSTGHQIGVAVELIVTPLTLLWQARVAQTRVAQAGSR